MKVFWGCDLKVMKSLNPFFPSYALTTISTGAGKQSRTIKKLVLDKVALQLTYNEFSWISNV